MTWSLSEFLNLFEFRSQSWCFVDLGERQGIRVPHADAAFFYALLAGVVRVSRSGGQVVDLQAGDIAFVISGEAHALRPDPEAKLHGIALLEKGGYVDKPEVVDLAGSAPVARMLCGRLKVRWPGGHRPRRAPPVLLASMEDSLLRFDRLIASSESAGASAIFTRSATLLFIDALREHPACQELFVQADLEDPIDRAMRFIEAHPFQKWTVDILATKVGMGRSNFAARFARKTGLTPLEAVTAQRMHHAAEFLAKSDLKIAEVSERVGYRSEAAFHERFTRFFGMTPAQLRRERRGKEWSEDEIGEFCDQD
jgi:AraC-like DNA-binding protein